MYNFVYGYGSFEYTINNLPFFFLFLIPLISSGVFTEERKAKTEQLLYTLPIKFGNVVVGKYLALISLILLPILVMGLYPLFISIYGEVNLGVSYANLLGIFLLASTMAAISMFISAVSGNQIVSGIVSFAIMFVLYKINTFSDSLVQSGKNSLIAFFIIAFILLVVIWVVTKNIFVAIIPSVTIAIIAKLLYEKNMQLIAGKANVIMDGMAIFTRMNNFMNGIFDWAAILYYLSVSATFVILTIFTLERRRWI